MALLRGRGNRAAIRRRAILSIAASVAMMAAASTAWTAKRGNARRLRPA